MTNQRVRDIKHAQRESFLLQEIANFFMQIMRDEPRLQGLYISRVKLSPDRGSCTIFFYTPGGMDDFEDKRPTLVLYKPSLRTALAKSMHSRYVPELIFKYDEQVDKQRRIDELIEKLKEEGKL